MDKGFRRIVFMLMGLTAITVISVGVYLWYNFNTRSNLVLVIPASSKWFLHVQTKKLRSDFAASTTPPKSVDSLKSTIASLSIFKGVKDASEPGIGLYSDVVAFEVDGGRFLCLALTSEEKFKAFVARLQKQQKLHKTIQKPRYAYAKFATRNVYLVYQYKVCMVFVPNDSIENAALNEKILDVVFPEKTHTMMQNPTVQALYEDEPELVFYSSDKSFGLSQAIDFPVVSDSKAPFANPVKFIYPTLMSDGGNKPAAGEKTASKASTKVSSKPSPLMLAAKAKLPFNIDACINPKNEMDAHTALDLALRVFNQSIHQISQ
jgi:hypothetical protein